MATTYQVTLKPQGVPLDQADDTKQFTFTSTAPDEALAAAVEDAVINNDVLDVWAFHEYWEIDAVNPVEKSDVASSVTHNPRSKTPVPAVKQALEGLTNQ